MKKNGKVCFVGQPNVGKSTLTNHYLDIPLAIESPKPQTTWYAVKGLLKHPSANIVLTDTPGIHNAVYRTQNQEMNRIAYSAISQADIICHLVTPHSWSEKDTYIHDFIKQSNKHKILLINKIDQYKDNLLFPFIAQMQTKESYNSVFSICAKSGLNCDILLEEIVQNLPEKNELFLTQNIHDHTTAFLAQEMVREQLMQQLLSEMPYTTFIEVFHTEEKNKTLHIDINLHVKHIGQKKIIIGKSGSQIKQIGQVARKRLQVILKKRIMLRLWVKINPQTAGNLYIEN